MPIWEDLENEKVVVKNMVLNMNIVDVKIEDPNINDVAEHI